MTMSVGNLQQNDCLLRYLFIRWALKEIVTERNLMDRFVKLSRCKKNLKGMKVGLN